LSDVEAATERNELPLSDEGPPEDGFSRHLVDALRHARKAWECYLALFSAKVKALAGAAVKMAALVAAFATAAVLGMFFFLFGLAQLIDGALGPKHKGAGSLIVGAGLLLAVGLGILLFHAKGRRQ
jgi:hypothetical protein